MGTPESLNIKTEMHDVAILYNIVFALHAHFSSLSAALFRLMLLIISEFDNLSSDEAFLKVAVDHAGRLGCFPSFLDRPGPHFLFARGEIRNQIE